MILNNPTKRKRRVLYEAKKVLFNISVKKMIFIILLLFLFSLPMVLLKRYEVAEILANFAYGVLFVVVIKLVIESFSD